MTSEVWQTEPAVWANALHYCTTVEPFFKAPSVCSTDRRLGNHTSAESEHLNGRKGNKTGSYIRDRKSYAGEILRTRRPC